MKDLLTPYPFTENEEEKTVEEAMRTNLQDLFQNPLFNEFDRNELMSTFGIYYDYAKGLFSEEEKLRAQNVPGANLYYHCKPHSVFQTTHDAISIVSSLLQRNDPHNTRDVERVDPILKHITPEATIAIIFGALFHDTGHVTDRSTDNYAARTSVHVEESARMFAKTIDILGLPNMLDKEKIKKLGQIGIHGTYFPFSTKRTIDKPDEPSKLEKFYKMVEDFPPDLLKEAHIVRLSVQLADLGGQCARPDYFPNLVRKLREELNCVNPGLGTLAIGEEHELEAKKEIFINTFVKQPPTFKRNGTATKVPSPAPNVELTARSFFRDEKSKPFRDAWSK